MKKLICLACFGICLVSCVDYNDTITCYTNDGKVFYQAEKVRVAAVDGVYYVRDKNEKLTVVSGNCVAK